MPAFGPEHRGPVRLRPIRDFAEFTETGYTLLAQRTTRAGPLSGLLELAADERVSRAYLRKTGKKGGKEREHRVENSTAHKEKRHSTGKDTVAVFRSVTFRFNFSAVLQKRDSTTFPRALSGAAAAAAVHTVL